MSFVDTMGPFVAWCLLGVAGLLVAVAVLFFLYTKVREIDGQRNAISADGRYMRLSRDLANDVIAEDSIHPGLIPDNIVKQAEQIRESADRKGIR